MKFKQIAGYLQFKIGNCIVELCENFKHVFETVVAFQLMRFQMLLFYRVSYKVVCSEVHEDIFKS